MSRRILPLSALALSAACIFLPVAPASAGAPKNGTFVANPTTGPGLTSVSLTSVTPCFNLSVNPEPVVAWTDVNGATTDIAVVVDGSGNWSGTFQIPASAPIGVSTFEARCQYVANGGALTRAAIGTVPPGSANLFAYDPVTFSVVPLATTTTTTTSTTTSTTTTSLTTTTTIAPTTTTSSQGTTTTTAPAPTITVTPTVTDGENILVSTTGWQPGSTITAIFESDPIMLGTLVADTLGNATKSFALPSGVPTGAHTVKLTGTGIAGQVQVLAAPVTVTRSIAAAVITATTPTTQITTTLPVTGGDITTPTGVAVLLFGVGGALLIVARRRHGS